jgi:hypothetical protein
MAAAPPGHHWCGLHMKCELCIKVLGGGRKNFTCSGWFPSVGLYSVLFFFLKNIWLIHRK